MHRAVQQGAFLMLLYSRQIWQMFLTHLVLISSAVHTPLVLPHYIDCMRSPNHSSYSTKYSRRDM